MDIDAVARSEEISRSLNLAWASCRFRGFIATSLAAVYTQLSTTETVVSIESLISSRNRTYYSK